MTIDYSVVDYLKYQYEDSDNNVICNVTMCVREGAIEE